MRRSVAIVAALLLCACGKQQAQTNASPTPLTHEQLRLAFKTSFLHACMAGIPGPSGELYCNCTDQRLEVAFDDAHLAVMKPDDPALRQIEQICAKKAGITLRPEASGGSR